MTRAEARDHLFLAETEAMNAKAAIERVCALLSELVNGNDRLDDAEFARKRGVVARQLALASGDVIRATGHVDAAA
jgi:hypothetical protein